MSSISVIIVNYNSSPQLSQCLDTLRRYYPAGEEIIVVDNASTDGSRDLVRNHYPEVDLVCLPENLGFPGGVNAGIQAAVGEALLILNSDVYLTASTVSQLIDYLTSADDIGLVGPAQVSLTGEPFLTFHRNPGLIQELIDTFFLWDVWRYRVFKNWILNLKPVTADVDWLSGAAMLANKKTVDEVGMFDERVFMYGEEFDFQYRCWQKGWRVCYVPEARVIHEKSVAADAYFSHRRLAAITKSYLFFYAKHQGSGFLFIVGPLRLIRSTIRFVFGCLLILFNRNAGINIIKEHLEVIRLLLSGSTYSWVRRMLLAPSRHRRLQNVHISKDG
jgi:GT2 family glycosyltransferase